MIYTAIAIDTNILLRSLQKSHPHHAAAVNAVSVLATQGVLLHVFPQNIREFWNVATRPLANNGLGLTILQAEAALQLIEPTFVLLGDGLPAYYIWRRNVIRYNVSGVQVHDCYIAAAMEANGLRHLLTFNASDFARYGVTVVDPNSI